MNETVIPLYFNLTFGHKFLIFCIPSYRRLLRVGHEMLNRQFKGDYSETGAINEFNAYNRNVEQKCPKEKFLKFEVKDGWGPLCEFLGKEIPNVGFPRINDTKEFQSRGIKANRLGKILFGILCLITIGGVSYLLKKYVLKK